MARSADNRGDRDAAAKGVSRLSRLLTRERDRMPAAYLRDAELRAAYRAYFLPVNLAKVRLPLSELAFHPSRPLQRGRLRVLDVGAGPGTALLGVLAFFLGRKPAPVLEFTAADQVAANLRIAETLFGELRDRSGAAATLRTVSCRVEDLQAHVDGAFDLIIVANVLNELFPDAASRISRRIELLDGMVRRLLAPNGSCVIIEPALRETGRDLLGVRDGLLDAGWHVYAPCLMQERCPCLANPKDWCHEDRPWEPPEIVREIDARTGLRKDSLKFSYCILREDDASLADVHGADAFRVVSEPLVSKGKIDLYLCGKGGRRLATRLDREASAANAGFAQLLRGDVVRFGGLAAGEHRCRVTKETAVIICRRPDSVTCGTHEPKNGS
jgi:ribosomal protein RSM22 (predicted rRNA methylase)